MTKIKKKCIIIKGTLIVDNKGKLIIIIIIILILILVNLKKKQLIITKIN